MPPRHGGVLTGERHEGQSHGEQVEHVPGVTDEVSGPRPALTGTGLSDGAVSAVSVALAFVMATVVQMVLGEPAPKNLALAVPERLAKSLSASTLAYRKVVGPVVHLFDAPANKPPREQEFAVVRNEHGGFGGPLSPSYATQRAD